MDDAQEQPRRGMWWGLPVSAALHILIAILLLLKLPDVTHQPAKEQAVKVDIVPEKEAPKPPEPKAAENPSAPPPPQQPAAEQQPRNIPIPTLRPVYQFGEKDEGQKSLEGNAAEGEKDAPDTAADKPPEMPEAKPEPEVKTADTSIDVPKDDVQGVPDILKALEQDNASKAEAAGKPRDEKAASPDPSKAKALTAARKIFSDTSLGGRAAVLAMGDMPRDVRISQLCATELREQLRHTKPGYSPELLPAFRLRTGNVLDVPTAAFRTRDTWYDVSFRCEVDEGGTRVLSFAFHVGDPVPRSQWKARHFPEN